VGGLSFRVAARIAFYSQVIKLAPLMKKIRTSSLPAMLMVFAFAPFAHADQVPGQRLGGANVEERAGTGGALRDGISLDEAVSRAEQQYHARVVRTDVQDEDGRKVYVLKLLSDNGRVFTVRIDAASGRMR
jgi:Peptidase propeptide and YPEB domain